MGSEKPQIFLIAGEPSGDVLGGRLMAALRTLTDDQMRFVGVGGDAMQAQGLESLFPMEELSVMGVAEILPHLPRLLRRIRETANAVDQMSPDALITIDSPDFTRRVARRVRNRLIPRIHYVAPTVWAWRPGRAAGFAQDFSHLLALLPFEPPWFEREGMPCTFVGHPVIEAGAEKGNGSAFRARHGIDPECTVICVLPGSRRGEVTRLSADFATTLALMSKRRPAMRVVVPTVKGVAPLVQEQAARWAGEPVLVQGDEDKYGAMAAADVALAASGTVALELSLASLPTVVAYRFAPLTHFIVRRMVSVKYGNLINIIEGREVIPEFVQDACQPEHLANALEKLLGPAGPAQIEACQAALRQLGRDGPPPSTRAAQVVLDILGGGRE